MEIAALPFNRLIGLERSTREGGVFELPARERYTNHPGTVHASAILALAEATSGEILVRGLGGLGFGVVPVVRRVDARFRKAASGAIYSRYGDTRDLAEALCSGVSTRGRGLAAIPVEVFDGSGTLVLSAKFEWFVARRDPA